MKQYLDALSLIMKEGVDREGRNGWTRGCFDIGLRFNLEKGFPAVTTKKLVFKTVVAELLWFISGSTDNNDFKKLLGKKPKDKTIWSDDIKNWGKSRFPGDAGKNYSEMWRHWPCTDGTEIDQLMNSIKTLKTNPYSRRNLVTAWNPEVIRNNEVSLPSCHRDFQLGVYPEKNKNVPKYLCLKMTQRSCDMFLGVPFNIASYAVLLSVLAQLTNLIPLFLVISLVDAHIYHQHFEQVKEILTRKPLVSPKLWLNSNVKNIDDFTMEDFELRNYNHHPSIKAPLITADIK